ncbi:MAG TPA: hypothetical protein VI757_13610 [Bacteroidia bacterium]|nr:hypothetical protein [Bacteroidia bacterium]
MSDVTRIPTQPSALASYLETTDDYQTAAILPAPPNYTRWNWTSQESTDWHDFRVNYGTLYQKFSDKNTRNKSIVAQQKVLNKAIHKYDNDTVTGHHLLDRVALTGTIDDCEIFRVKRGTALADTTPTGPPDPGSVAVTIAIKKSEHLLTQLLIKTADQVGRGRPKGIKEIMVFKAITAQNAPAPALKDYQYVGDVKRGLTNVQHEDTVEGSKAWFFARVKNSKGETGPPSSPVSVSVM